MENAPKLVTLAVIGGTGKEGSGLASHWAKAGYPVIIGSRDAGRARQKAAELNAELGAELLSGDGNQEAAEKAGIVVLTVPYESHRTMLESLKDVLQGKILIDVTVPLQPPKVRTVFVPDGKSASLEAQRLLGPSVRVVTAYQNVSSIHLQGGAEHVDCDVLICGDDEAAKNEVIGLTRALGMRGIDAGSLANSVAVEALTPVLLYINRKYKVKSSGIVITGIEAP